MTDIALADFTVADFRRRARAHALPPETGDYGDHRWNGGLADLFPRENLREAAVLVAVVERAGEASVILTKRTETLRSHSGQIAFPGGRVDPDDESAEAAALREAEEEIGLARATVEVVGRLPDYLTGSGYRIAPVLGIAQPSFTLTLNPAEVDAAFEVPLRFLMTEANHREESRLWQGVERKYYAMPWEDRRIWGVTAGILRVLYERLYR